jgi:acetyl-CoA carboxylase biotin carboxylase subunit
VHSTADSRRDACAHGRRGVCIGPPPGTDSYLSMPAIISACEITGARRSTRAMASCRRTRNFVQIVEDHGLTFIGPSAEHIRIMGDKITAKDTMKALGVPCVPGSDGGVPDARDGRRWRPIGYPVIIKATAGGGGRGMKLARTPTRWKRLPHRPGRGQGRLRQ